MLHEGNMAFESLKMNIVEELFLHSDREAVAVIDKGKISTYGALDDQSASIAKKIKGALTFKGVPRVGLICEDGMEYVALSLGILRSGCCLVPIAPELTESERDNLISTIRLDAMIHHQEALGDQISFSIEELQGGGLRECFDKLNPAFIRFSSGTTGVSKGIVLSHETLLERIETANQGLKIASEDRILWVLSMSHHYAVSIMLYLWNGAAIVLPDSYLPGDMLAAANRHEATVIYAAPCHFIFLSSGENKEILSWPSLRMAVSTTAPLYQEASDRFVSAYGIRPFQAMGVMEVGLPFINSSGDGSKDSSVGRPLPGFDVEIRDSNGMGVEAGTQGELFLKGPGMFDAYIDPWQTREQVTAPNGWFSTGDIARMDFDGYVSILGRSRTIINVGGMKFFPEEVERCISTVPGVLESRVIATPHPTFGSVPIAEIVKADGEEVHVKTLVAHSRKHLARYKVPIEFRFVGSIQKTPTGKIKRL
jgi:long-chain acyl-CoA synthetase